MAILIHPLKLLYIRVPKTGSTSFVGALDNLKPEHIGSVHGNMVEARHLLERTGRWSEIAEYTCVGFIRHPYDWVRSCFAHWRQAPTTFPEVKGAKSLHGFVHRFMRTPLSWLCDAAGKLVCECWKTEDMSEIMPRLGLVEYRKRVRADNMPIDESTKALVRDKFARVFEIGGYHA